LSFLLLLLLFFFLVFFFCFSASFLFQTLHLYDESVNVSAKTLLIVQWLLIISFIAAPTCAHTHTHTHTHTQPTTHMT
jgi:hypothetical protein